MITLKVDFSDLLKLDKALPDVQRQFDAAIVPALNEHGEAMHAMALEMLSDRMMVPREEIANAVDVIPATSGMPRYSMSASNIEFPFVIWVTKRDERVCQICGPRDGVQYRLNDALEIFPAHPNCRCGLTQANLVGEFLRIGSELLPIAQEGVIRSLGERFGEIWKGVQP